jgi:hypothetical protein
MAEHQCVHCNKTDDETKLSKCPICFKYYCNEHAYQMSGRTFCSQPCAEFFFFSETDE